MASSCRARFGSRRSGRLRAPFEHPVAVLKGLCVTATTGIRVHVLLRLRRVRWAVGAENLIRSCEEDEWIEVVECVNSILAMSEDV